MDLNQHYTQMWQQSLSKFQQGSFEYDNMIENKADDRMGLTLLIKPDTETKERIASFLHHLQSIAPHQYYYPLEAIHITVLSVISCYAGFKLDQIDIADYVDLIAPLVHETPSFDITFKGITASSSCIMLQGFPKDSQLEMLRNKLREKFKHAQLQQSLDQRYLLETAHSTVVRFKTPLQNETAFLHALLKYRASFFGTFEVKSIDLVYNDWYHREERVKQLHDFEFG